MLIRKAEPKDIDSVADMFERMYTLNSEFDPLLQVHDEISERLKRSLVEDLKSEDSLVAVAEDGGKVIGAVRVRLERREYYIPEKMAVIEEIYVMPGYRREGVGEKLVDFVISELSKKGARSIMARFPAKNIIAESFYRKRGFREIHYEFIKRI
ncbi:MULTISPECIES: GNAT family N-acetyltransferase [Metallosphaera]|uniref:GCN5-related N-acetyltransferase n=3 Tax=Metallosphaera TaxID=41980 RepID=A4YFL6_METS5|nr:MULTISPECIES: GNAT family N-acetyltransferase [Metallosphaera]ABP95218.1 GCN5-related N-acetyltransferase [Metallosphaera sedula DSM 5348]AIM27204.1 GCN5-related N-acetyltransferase [Metallosphaera sedula]AKV74100.1 GCN5 family acetyltransferase [Metallosphaera sedula]AKV76340.1 GCN5 family acetyltransferase [Metallosphaera sedula]AKV78591.1 GCN5 family acetyltransferase [Metallosphaera sedula]